MPCGALPVPACGFGNGRSLVIRAKDTPGFFVDGTYSISAWHCLPMNMSAVMS
jgi:hypothetical protein